MARQNPTFSELWYRVAELRPRLRATVQTHRQHFRGRIWHVVQDPVNNEFFRLHPAAYRFIGLLDGRRTVADAWRRCVEQLGDEAPTQTEAIGVLGQLYAANLLQADLPPDALGLFQRYRKRRGRRITGQLANFLFVRVPLFDPDRLLNALVGVVGLAFTAVGFLVWLIVVGAGVYLALGNWRELTGQAERLLSAEHLARNIPLLYGAFILTKILHEFGHAFACKKFGRRVRGGGEVHVMGVMFLVLAPMPFVDASSAHALPRKLHRVIVGAAGMMAELALAAVAAVVWTWTAGAEGPQELALHAVAYNVMFIASAATLVFNANPLLRFDGYYILSDLLEVPNLSSRSRQFLAYLVKRFVWGVRQAINPSHSAGEAAWLAFYGLAATAFQIFICVRILLMLAERLFFVGVALAAAAAVTWLLVPLGKFLHYLLAGPELARARPRAIAITVLAVGGAAAALGLARARDCRYVEAVVEPARLAYIHADADGFVRDVLPADVRVAGPDANAAEARPLLVAVNRDLEVELRGLGDEREILIARQRIARLNSTTDPRYLALVQVLQEDLDSLDRQRAMLGKELASLTIRPPFAGTWLTEHPEQLRGAYVRRGEQVGLVASLDRLVLRATPTHRLAGMLLAEADPNVEIRLPGRPGVVICGTWKQYPAARRRQSADRLDRVRRGRRRRARAEAEDEDKAEAADRHFDLEITPGPTDQQLLPGQRAVVRLRLPDKPLLAQWWRSARQLVQRRFGI